MKSSFRPLEVWINWVLLRPYLILGAAIALAVGSVLFTFQNLDFQTSQLDLISPRHPLIQLSEKIEPFEGDDSFIVIVQAPTPERAVAFIESLAQKTQNESAYFSEVLYRIDPSTSRPWALLFMDESDLHRIGDRLREYRRLINGLAQRPDLMTFMSLINQEMSSRMIGELFTGFLEEEKEEDSAAKAGPMDLGFLIQPLRGLLSFLNGNPVYHSPWSAFFEEESWNKELQGYFWVNEKRYLLAFVTPYHEEDDFNVTRRHLEYLRWKIDETRASFPDIQVGVTGQEALKTDEMTVAFGDMSRATSFSLMAVCILMLLFLRGVRRPLIEMVSVVIGMCWTFGWATVFIGHLNILSVVFAPLLAGVGVDYGIHFFARYEEEERDKKLRPYAIIQRVVGRSGRGILMAGLCGVLSFFPLVLTGFKGLVELGLITGMGILFTLLADFTVLPALSLLLAGRRKVDTPRVREAETGNLLRLSPLAARLVLIGGVILCVGALWSGSKVRFDLNLLRLQSKNAESVIWEKELILNSSQSVLNASALASSIEELALKSRKLESLPSVGKVQSVITILPEDQDRKIRLLRGLSEDVPDRLHLTKAVEPTDAEALTDVLKRIRFKMQPDQADQWGANRPLLSQMEHVRALTGDIIEVLQRTGDASTALREYDTYFSDDLRDVLDLLSESTRTTSPMRIQDLPKAVQDRFVNNGNYLIKIYPERHVWEREPLMQFVQELRSMDPNVAGDAITLHDFTSAFRRACIEASFYAMAAIFLFLALTLRGLVLPLFAMIPLMVGTIWTLGLMGLMKVDFNLANSIFMPLIVGVGVEYGVIIIHRWREGRMPPGHLPISTAKGVILAALTTTLGFGSLMISRHQGIFSLGFVALTGSLCVLLAAVLLLTALLSFLKPPSEFRSKE